MKNLTVTALSALALAAILAFAPAAALAQRMSDKDVEKTMNNLKEDAKKFQNNFDNAIKKSTIRKTSQEKDARQDAKTFVKQAEGMRNHFKSKKKAENELQVVNATAARIENVLNQVQLNPGVHGDWSRVRAELDTLNREFGMNH
jgi:uncharacterized membrane protein YhiD involved in acid resistance